MLTLSSHNSDKRATQEKVLAWVAEHAPPEKGEVLRKWLADGKVKVLYHPYDWSANSK